MSQIIKLSISNFRTIKFLEIDASNFNPIVGYNNSGKSNLIRAIYWLLKKSTLDARDFNDQGSELWVSATIDDAQSMISVLPDNQQRQIKSFIANDKITFRRIQPSPNCSAKDIKIEVLDGNGQWAANPTGLDTAIGKALPEPVYIKAMDDAEDDVAKFGARNTIGLLIKFAMESARLNNQASVQTLESDIARVGAHLNGPNRLNEINNLELRATNSINSLFPGISINLEMPPPSIDEIIKATKIKLREIGGQDRDFSDYGHGTQRTVQMALINLLAETTKNTHSNTNTLILIDEPELYLHPQAIGKVKSALKTLSNGDFQIFFSTHSPLMIEAGDAAQTMVFWKCPNGGTNARPKASNALASLNNNNSADVLFSLNHSSQWLFSDRPVVVEGKTERTLLPLIYKICSNKTLQESSIALIEAGGGSGSRPISELLESLGYSPKCIYDLDFAFKLAPSIGLISNNDPDLLACLSWLSTNSAAHNINLNQAGLPEKSGASIKAEEAYAIMAGANTQSCMNLHSKLLPKNIWIWPGGAIESHLGIPKSNSAKAQFAYKTETNGNIDHAGDKTTIQRLATWLQQ
ncbi:ATP-dependent nuclease [Stenotrophomonas pictorum]|nr:AAA family ATPase [Stenotrophomonas pictorum]